MTQIEKIQDNRFLKYFLWLYVLPQLGMFIFGYVMHLGFFSEKIVNDVGDATSMALTLWNGVVFFALLTQLKYIKNFWLQLVAALYLACMALLPFLMVSFAYVMLLTSYL
jgi:hypothetical protein